jgi:hypothetical protein
MGGTMYLAGKLTNSSKSFNTTILMRGKDGNYQIITIRVN